MANFLLVHGAWQGAWIWPAVSAGLNMRGHEVHTLDLPGSGDDQTPQEHITLSSYAEAIVNAIGAIGKPVTLVGHSVGGIAVTAAAELAAERIARIIYLCAFVPCDGDSLHTMNELVPPLQRTQMAMEGNGISIATMDTSRTNTFMHDAPWAVSAWARTRFRPQAIAPLTTPVRISDDHYGKIPRSYIVCTRDQAIDPALQRVMATRAGCSRIKEMPSGHSPFLSDPSATAELFHRLVTEQ